MKATFDEVVDRLQKATDANTELVEAIRSLTGHNTPTAYDNEEDDAGYCSYCYGWNMEHKEHCEIKKAEAIADKYEVK